MKKIATMAMAAAVLVVTMAAAAQADTWDRVWKPDGNKYTRTIIYR